MVSTIEEEQDHKLQQQYTQRYSHNIQTVKSQIYQNKPDIYQQKQEQSLDNNNLYRKQLESSPSIQNMIKDLQEQKNKYQQGVKKTFKNLQFQKQKEALEFLRNSRDNANYKHTKKFEANNKVSDVFNPIVYFAPSQYLKSNQGRNSTIDRRTQFHKTSNQTIGTNQTLNPLQQESHNMTNPISLSKINALPEKVDIDSYNQQFSQSNMSKDINQNQSPKHTGFVQEKPFRRTITKGEIFNSFSQFSTQNQQLLPPNIPFINEYNMTNTGFKKQFSKTRNQHKLQKISGSSQHFNRYDGNNNNIHNIKNQQKNNNQSGYSLARIPSSKMIFVNKKIDNDNNQYNDNGEKKNNEINQHNNISHSTDNLMNKINHKAQQQRYKQNQSNDLFMQSMQQNKKYQNTIFNKTGTNYSKQGKFQSHRNPQSTFNSNSFQKSQIRSLFSRSQLEKQPWKEHYGEHHRQPFFNNISIDERLYNMTPKKKQQFISDKQFYPAGQAGVRGVFSSYEYYYQNSKDQKICQPIEYNEKNFKL